MIDDTAMMKWIDAMNETATMHTNLIISLQNQIEALVDVIEEMSGLRCDAKADNIIPFHKP